LTLSSCLHYNTQQTVSTLSNAIGHSKLECNWCIMCVQCSACYHIVDIVDIADIVCCANCRLNENSKHLFVGFSRTLAASVQRSVHWLTPVPQDQRGKYQYSTMPSSTNSTQYHTYSRADPQSAPAINNISRICGLATSIAMSIDCSVT